VTSLRHFPTLSIYLYSIFSTSKLLASGPAALGASFERSQSGNFGSFLSLRFFIVEHRRLFVLSRSVSDLEIVEHRRLLFDFPIVNTTVFSVANSSTPSTCLVRHAPIFTSHGLRDALSPIFTSLSTATFSGIDASTSSTRFVFHALGSVSSS
jgi:hypothetical protein